MRKYGWGALAGIVVLAFSSACGSATISTQNMETEEMAVESEQQEEAKAEVAEAVQEAQPQEVEEKAVEEVEEELTLEEILQDTQWQLFMERKYDFSCNDVLCYDENNIIAVGYAGEIHYYESSDDTCPRAENTSLCRFGIDILDGNICYTCGNTNVTKSVDGGKTFEKKTDFASTDNATMISFIDENTGIVASKKVLGITKDGAETWTYLELPSDEEILCIKMETADEFCFIDRSFNIHFTEDGGASWESIPLNLPEGTNYIPVKKNIEITKDCEDVYTIYCVDKDSFMLKSYTTNDRFYSCTENEMPLLKANGYSLHMRGKYLTLTHAKDMIILEKKDEL